MTGTILLFTVAIALRILGTLVRIGDHWFPIRMVGWVLCTTAAWMAAGAVGAWFPWWPALALAIVGLLIAPKLGRHKLWSGADLIGTILPGLLSIPPVAFGLLAGTAVTMAGIGFAVDALLTRSPQRVRTTIFFGFPCAAFLTVGLMKPTAVMDNVYLLWNLLLQQQAPAGDVGSLRNVLFHTQLLHLGLTPAHEAERVVLETGAIAWLEHPAGTGPFPGAIFFHGNNHDGSRQSSAVIIRRALLEAGFVVLAVDHPGYGQSPLPPLDADIDAWDPLPTSRAAVKMMRTIPGVDRIFVLGHSMGVGDVLRLLKVEPEIAGAVLFGGSLNDPSSQNEYWYERFHTDRRILTPLSREQVLEIRTRFYNNDHSVQALPPSHPPILFVRFGDEWANIVATRDALYETIPGAKTTWDFVSSTHYFSSWKGADLIFGDTRVTRQLVQRLRLLAAELPEAMDGRLLGETGMQ